MRRRLLAWILVTPVTAAGVLATHGVAYRLTGASPGPVHDYLTHVPQALVVLGSLALVGLALQDRSLSIADIAFFLQYSEPAAFHRSFRRWTGQTPRAFRDVAARAR